MPLSSVPSVTRSTAPEASPSCPSAQARPAQTLAALRHVVSEARASSSARPDTDVVVRMLMEEPPALTAR